MVVEQSAPRAAKSAERIDGAIMAGGDIAAQIGMEMVKFWDTRSQLLTERVVDQSNTNG